MGSELMESVGVVEGEGSEGCAGSKANLADVDRVLAISDSKERKVIVYSGISFPPFTTKMCSKVISTLLSFFTCVRRGN